jgi:hypothetical protein
MAKLISEGPPDIQERRGLMLADDKCHEKAKLRGQLTFTLVEQDPTAGETILEWIKLNWRTAPVPKLRDAFEKALAMAYPQVPQKNAD